MPEMFFEGCQRWGAVSHDFLPSGGSGVGSILPRWSAWIGGEDQYGAAHDGRSDGHIRTIEHEDLKGYRTEQA